MAELNGLQAHIQCPECGEVIAVDIALAITSHDGTQYLQCDPDMADLWAHAWTHEAAVEDGKGGQT